MKLEGDLTDFERHTIWICDHKLVGILWHNHHSYNWHIHVEEGVKSN